MATYQYYEPRPLTINEKICVLNDMKAGFTLAIVSNKYLISVDQILLIAGSELSIQELSEYYRLAENMPMKNGLFPGMENILYLWYLQQTGRLTNAQIIEKARSIIAITEEKPSKGSRSFKGTSSWVTGFKKRYDIPLRKKTCGLNQNSELRLEPELRHEPENRTPTLNDKTGEIMEFKTEQVGHNFTILILFLC